MHRIDGPGHTPSFMFTEGDPVSGVEATTMTDDWANDVQENIMAVLAAAGVTAVKGRAADLVDAIQSLISTGGSLGGTSLSDYTSFKFKDKTSGVTRTFFLMWGTGTTNALGKAIVTFPLTFPNALLFSIPVSGQNLAAAYAYTSASVNGATFPLFNSSTGATSPAGAQMYYVAGGY